MQEHDINKLLSELKNADKTKGVSAQTMQEAVNGLSQSQKSKIDALLEDPEKLNALLHSPIAEKLRRELQD